MTITLFDVIHHLYQVRFSMYTFKKAEFSLSIIKVNVQRSSKISIICGSQCLFLFKSFWNSPRIFRGNKIPVNLRIFNQKNHALIKDPDTITRQSWDRTSLKFSNRSTPGRHHNLSYRRSNNVHRADCTWIPTFDHPIEYFHKFLHSSLIEYSGNLFWWKNKYSSKKRVWRSS